MSLFKKAVLMVGSAMVAIPIFAFIVNPVEFQFYVYGIFYTLALLL